MQAKRKEGKSVKKAGTVTHDNKLSPGDDEIKKISVSSVTSVAKSNFIAIFACPVFLYFSRAAGFKSGTCLKPDG